uniref:Tamulustoxin-2 n=1 Tax=Hottentotta tamulus TaxID=34647 RepID=KAXU2_HOTTA
RCHFVICTTDCRRNSPGTYGECVKKEKGKECVCKS